MKISLHYNDGENVIYDVETVESLEEALAYAIARVVQETDLTEEDILGAQAELISDPIAVEPAETSTTP